MQGSGDTHATSIVAGSGNDLIRIDFGGATGGEGSLPAFSNDTISGGSGTNTLQVGVAASIADTDFANISNFQALSLTGASAVTLDAGALATGIQSVFGGNGDSTYSEPVLGSFQIYAGSGSDTLIVSTQGQVINDAFPAISGIEALSLSGNDAVTLGANASTNSISTIFGANSETLNSVLNTLTVVMGDSLSFNASGDNSAKYDTITAGNHADLSYSGKYSGQYSNITTGTDANLTFSGKYSGANDTIMAGTGASVSFSGDHVGNQASVSLGANSALTLNGNFAGYSAAVTLGDNSSASITGISALQSSNVSLGSGDSLTFSGWLSGNQATITTGDSASVTFADNTQNSGDTITTGNGANTLSGLNTSSSVTTGTGADLISFTGGTALGSSTLDAGAGIDTLGFTNVGSVDDSAFAHVAGVEFLTLDGNSAATLGANAAAAGILTVSGGSDSLSVDATAFTNPLTILANGSYDTLSAGDYSAITATGWYDSVNAGDNATINLIGAGDTIVAGDDAAITLGNQVSIFAGYGDSLTAGNNATITSSGYGNQSITALADAKITLGTWDGHSTVTAGANALLSLSEQYDQVTLGNNATLSASGAANAITASDSLHITNTGSGSGQYDTITAGKFASINNQATNTGTHLTVTLGDSASIVNSGENSGTYGTISLGADASITNSWLNAGQHSSIVAGNGLTLDNSFSHAGDFDTITAGSSLTAYNLGANSSLTAGDYATITANLSSDIISVSAYTSLTGNLSHSNITANGSYDTLVVGDFNTVMASSYAATITAGDGNSITLPNSFVTLTAGDDLTLSSSSNYNRINAEDNASLTYTTNNVGYNDALSLGSGASITALHGHDLRNASIVAGSGFSLTTDGYASGNRDTITAGDNATLSYSGSYNGNRSTISLGANASVTASSYKGLRNSSLTAGNGASISLSGTNSAQYATLTAGNGASISLSGTNSAEYATITAGNDLTLTGSVWSALQQASVVAANGALIELTGGDEGSAATFSLGDSATVHNAFGSGFQATITAGDSLSLTNMGAVSSLTADSYANITAFGAYDIITVNDHASLTGSIWNSSITANGDHDTLSVGNGNTLTASGSYASITAADGNLIALTHSGYTTYDTVRAGDGLTLNSASSYSYITARNNASLTYTTDYAGSSDFVSLGNSATVIAGHEGNLSAASITAGNNASLTFSAYAAGYRSSLTAGNYATLSYAQESAGERQTLVAGDFASLVAGIDSAALQVASLGDSATLSYTEAGYRDTITAGDSLSVYNLGNQASLTTGASAYITLSGSSSGYRDTITTGDGANTILGLGGLDSVITGSGTDLLSIRDADNLGTSTIDGGAGIDTLRITAENQLNVNDATFAHLSNTEVLEVGSHTILTLGANASAAGISTLIAHGPVTVVEEAGFTGGIYIDASGNTTGSSYNYYTLSGTQFSADTIIGSANTTDSLSITTGAVIEDAGFANKSNLDILTLAGNDEVTLGGNASSSGITTIYGGDGETLTQNNGNSLTIDVQDSTSILVSAGGGGYADTISAGDNAAMTFEGNYSASYASIVAGANATLNFAVTHSSSYVGRYDTISVGDNASLNFSGYQTGYGDSIIAGSGATLAYTRESAGSHASISLGDTALVSFDSGAYDVTITAGNGGNTITGLTYRDSVTTGSGNDQIGVYNYLNVLASETINAGAGNDTLSLTYMDQIADSSFANLSNIEALSLTGTSEVILGAEAMGAGFQSIYGGVGNNTITHTADDTLALNIQGAAGQNNLVNIDFGGATGGEGSLPAFNNDTINGGAGGNNTLNVGVVSTLADSDFAKVSNFSALSLTGASAVTLDANAQTTGFATVFGGDGGNTFVQGSGNTNSLTLIGGSGNDLFGASTQAQLANDSIVGLAGIDTLQVNSGNYADSAFANISGIEALKANDSAAITLGGNVQNAGIASIYGGTGSNTIVQTAGDNLATTIVAGNASSVSLYGSSYDSLTAGDSLSMTLRGTGGNAGHNTISAGDKANIAVIGLGGDVSNNLIEANDSLTFTFTGQFGGSFGHNTITAVDNARITLAAGAGGTGGYLSLSAGDSLNLSIAGAGGEYSNGVISAGDHASMTLQGLGGGFLSHDTISVGDQSTITLLGGTSNEQYNSIVGGDSLALSFDSLSVGGTGVSDTIVAGSHATLSLGGGTNTHYQNSIVAGANALISFSGVNLTAYLDTITATQGDNTITGLTTANSITTGSGYDLIGFGVGNLADNTVSAGSGYDSLWMMGGATLADSAFAHISSTEVLTLGGATAVTLGANAQNAGFQEIYGSSLNDTIVQTAGDTLPMGIRAGNGNDSVFIATGNQMTLDADYDVLNGGNGSDTLTVGSAATLDNGNFTSIYNFEALQLTSDTLSGNMVTLGSNAGFSSVFAGAGHDTISQLSSGSSYLYFDLSQGTGDSLSVASDQQLASDTVIGGSGTDTIAITNGNWWNTVNDSSFTNVSSTEVLALNGNNGGNNITVSSYAFSAGISTITTNSVHANYVTQTGGMDRGLYIDVSSASSYNRLVISKGDQFAADTIHGSSNAWDRIEITSASTLNDSAFANKSGLNELDLLASSSVTLGDNAEAAGFTEIYGSGGSDTVIQTANDTLHLGINVGGGNDYVLIATQDQFDHDIADGFVSGGSGSDTLVIDQTVILNDAFPSLDSFEGFGVGANSAVTLAGNAQDAGIYTLIGGTGSNTITQTIDDNLHMVLDGSRGTAGNLFRIATPAMVGNDTIIGGSGIDTLFINSSSNNTTYDSLLAHVQSVEVIQFADGVYNYATLGANAEAAGISTVVSGSGNNRITQTADKTTPLYFDGTAASWYNSFYIGTGAQFIADTIAGSSNTGDYIEVLTASTLDDSAFVNQTNVNYLQVDSSNGDGSAVTLGANAQAAGYRYLEGGYNNDTLTQTAADTLPVAIYAQNGNDLINISTGTQVVADANWYTLDGGNGIDTLHITDGPATLSDSDFRNIYSVEALQLTSKAAGPDATLVSALQDSLTNYRSSYNTASSNYNADTLATSIAQSAYDSASSDYTSAYAAYTAAQGQLTSDQATVTSSQSAYILASAAYDSASSAYSAAQTQLNNDQASESSSQSAYDSASADYASASSAYTAAQDQLAQDQGMVDSSQSAYDSASSAYDSASSAFNTASGDYSSASGNYIIANSDYQTAVATGGEGGLSIADAQSALDAATNARDAAGIALYDAQSAKDSAANDKSDAASALSYWQAEVSNDQSALAGAQSAKDTAATNKGSAHDNLVNAQGAVSADNAALSIAQADLSNALTAKTNAAADVTSRQYTVTQDQIVLLADNANLTTATAAKSSASDALTAAQAQQSSDLSILQGLGSDTLAISNSLTSAQNNILPADGNSISLGWRAGWYSTGLSSIYGGLGSDSITQTSSSSYNIYFDGSAGSGDLFKTATGVQLYYDTVIGSSNAANIDTLEVNGLSLHNNWVTASSYAGLNGSNTDTDSLGGFGPASGTNSITLGGGAPFSLVSGSFHSFFSDTLQYNRDYPDIYKEIWVREYRNGKLVGVESFNATSLAGQWTGHNFSDVGPVDQIVIDSNLAAFSIDNLRIDTISAAVNDSSFRNVSEMDVLHLSNSIFNSATLDANAQASGISTVVSGSGYNLVRQMAGETNNLTFIGSDSGAYNTFEFATASQFEGSTVLGGASDWNRVYLDQTSSVSINDALVGTWFADKSNMNELDLALNGAASGITLAGLAQAAGLTDIHGTNANDTIVQTADNTLPLYLQGNLGNNLFLVATGDQLGRDTIAGNGSAAAWDTLHNVAVDGNWNTDMRGAVLTDGNGTGNGDRNTLAVGGVLNNPNDSLWGQIGNINVLVMGGDSLAGGNAINLGFNAKNNNSQYQNYQNSTYFVGSYYYSGFYHPQAYNGNEIYNRGLNTILGGTGSDTITQDGSWRSGTGTAWNKGDGDNGGHGLYIDVTDNAVANGGAHDTGAFISIYDQGLVGADTLLGGYNSNDTLRIDTDCGVYDPNLAHISNFDALILTGSSSIVVGENYLNAGFSSIFGGSGPNYIDCRYLTDATTYMKAQNATDTLIGGNQDDTLQGYTGDATQNQSGDTLNGGSGSDLYILGDATGNAYGHDGAVALIQGFDVATDRIQLHDYGVNNNLYTSVQSTVSGGGTGRNAITVYHDVISYNGTPVVDVLLASGMDKTHPTTYTGFLSDVSSNGHLSFI